MENRYILDWDAYAKKAREAAADGAVLLENRDSVLPFKTGEKVSVFGRIQLNYYKSGTGSGGLVNTKYVVGILDALLEEEGLSVNEALVDKYRAWEAEHPFDKGIGWGQEPWCQAEMPLSTEDVAAARAVSDTAIVVIGRTAGEDRDASADKGSWFLTDFEEDMLAKVCGAFDRVVVLLNVGGILDLSWMDRYQPSAVMLVWQGGQEGGHAVADLLMGRVNPSGRLTDTIAMAIEDYPSTACFGDPKADDYEEDIFVGYRYFETFAKDKVRYPFGFGLSYTTFALSDQKVVWNGGEVTTEVTVTNTGARAGRQVVQVYTSLPQGKLGKPARTLIGFAKTALLAPAASEKLTVTAGCDSLASYDEVGATGYANAFVCESGSYEIYIGTDVRSAAMAGCFTLPETLVVKQCREVLRPVEPFNRFHAFEKADGSIGLSKEPVPARTVDLSARIAAEAPADIPQTGDLGYRLGDVMDGKVSVRDFVGQFSDEELRCIVRGEGMCSSKVTPGTAAAFGGVTKALAGYGLPCGCCSDGPSGIRMDCGTTAFSNPNGTCLASTFDVKLNEELFTFLGCELRKNRIDTLLGPGINIQRNPLNGRNFEYFSEDPLLTGLMAAGQLKGLAQYGVTGTIKHFAANNQEFHRNDISSNVSERALREIYLKGFELAVKEGGAYLVMTTYGALNGIYTAGNYDLVTSVLRNEWGFDGAVMTDWWARVGSENAAPFDPEASGEGSISMPGIGGKPENYDDVGRLNFAAMVRAQNDLYMVTPDALSMEAKDNLKAALEDGYITRGMLQRCAENIVKVLLRSPCTLRELGRLSKEELAAQETMAKDNDIPPDVTYTQMPEVTGGEIVLDFAGLSTDMGAQHTFGLEVGKPGSYDIIFECKVNGGSVAQVPVTYFLDNTIKGAVTFRGTDGKWISERRFLDDIRGNVFLKLYFAQSGMELKCVRIVRTGDVERA